MAKRNKQQSKAAQDGESSGKSALATRQCHPSALATRQCHPPAKQPTLLAVSVILFALWFVFLLVTALFG
jgi:hypothetical protein